MEQKPTKNKELSFEIDHITKGQAINSICAILVNGFQFPPFVAVALMEEAALGMRKHHNIVEIKQGFTPAKSR